MQAWIGSWGSKKLILPEFLDNRHMYVARFRPPLPFRRYLWYSFLLEAESTLGPCYLWSWFEARSEVCSAERQAKAHDKNEVNFGTCSKKISFVCCTLVRCEGEGFKVTGIKFMTVFITRRDAACFLAWVTKILPLYLHGNGTFCAPFGSQQSASCYAW